MSKIGTFLRNLLPGILKGREKAVVAFLAPIVLAQVLHFFPEADINLSMVEQVVLALVTAITVHQTSNVPPPPPV